MASSDEHIRYSQFIARLEAAPRLDDAFVDAFMADVTSDPDQVMGQAAAIALIDHPALTEALLGAIQTAMPNGWAKAASRVAERRLQLKIETSPSDTSLWDDAVAMGSRRLHLWLLDQPNVPLTARESLATEGATRAVRNRASQALRR